MKVQGWMIVAAASAAVTVALLPVVPAVIFLLPALLLSLVLPIVAKAFRLLAYERGRVARSVEYLLVGAGFAAAARIIFSSVLDGSRPFNSGDHQIMLARAEEFANALYKGEWLRWTHAVQGGDSTTDAYPFLSNLVTALIHAFQPKDTSFQYSYSLFVLLAWWLRGFGAYYLARRFAGPLPATILATASMLEVGHDVWDGVWHAVLFFGMSHSAFALSLALFPAALQVDCLRGPTTPRLLMLATTTMVTALAHPLGILYSSLSVAALFGAGLVAPADRGKLVWTAAAMCTGLALAAFWTMPFAYALSHLSFSNAVPGIGYNELGRGLFDGSHPTTSYAAWTGFAAISILVGLFSRDVTVVSPALLSLALCVLTFQDLMIELRVFAIMPGLLDGQPRRLFTVLKTASLPCLAWLLAVILSRVRMPASLAVRPVLVRAALLVPLILGPGRALSAGLDHLVGKVREQLQGASSPLPHTSKGYDKSFAFVAQRRQEDSSPTPWRVGINWGRTWRHAAWAEGFKNGVPLVDYITIPATFLAFRPREISARDLAEWNIRYFITDGSASPFEGAIQRREAAPFTVWENPEYDDSFVVAPAGVSISNLRIHGNTIEFDVANAPSGGVDVRIRCAWYTRWKAYESASDVRATPPRLGAKPRQDQLLVHVQNGHAIVRCDGWPPRGLFGWFVSLVGMGALVVIGYPRLRQRTECLVVAVFDQALIRARDILPRLRRRLAAGSAAVAVGILLVIGFTRGSLDLLVPPLSNPMLSVRAGASGFDETCEREWWLSQYRCRNTRIRVELGLGASPRGDDTHEYARLWPATRVRIPNAGDTAELIYRRVDMREPALKIEYQTHGGFDIVLSAAGKPLREVALDGVGQTTFELPSSTPGVGPLSLRITAHHPGGWFAFRRY